MNLKKTLLMAAALLALTVGVASAAGLNLGWVDCAGLGAGLENRNFACAVNTGSHQLISSFVAPAGMLRVTGIAAVLDMQTSGAVLSPWWDFNSPSNPAGCRLGATLYSNDFSGVPGTGNCLEYFIASSGQGFNFPGAGGPNRQRFKHGHAITAGDLSIGPVAVNAEVYASRIQILNVGTVGGCGGCLDDACIVLNELLVTQEPGTPGGNFTLTNPAFRHHVLWQGGEGVICPGSTPTKKATWGSIKTLYR